MPLVVLVDESGVDLLVAFENFSRPEVGTRFKAQPHGNVPFVHFVAIRVLQYSFMIPLELIVRTPLEVWNPWGLNLIDGNPASGGSGAGTPASPWNAAYTQLWYNLLPPNFFSAGASDPADTTTGGVWIQASNGSA